MNETIREVAAGLKSGGAAFALLFVLVAAGVFVYRMGRAFWETVWPTVTSTLAGFLAEFKRSNDGLIALSGKVDGVVERVTGEHAITRAHVTAASGALIREIHAAREMTEQVIRERASDTNDLVREELSRTGEHAAVTPPDPPPRRAPTNPRMPAAR